MTPPEITTTPDGVTLALGGYVARIGTDSALRAQALALRATAFRNGASDVDRFDAACVHGCVAHTQAHADTNPHAHGRALVAFRLNLHRCADTLCAGYTGQFYNLAAWRGIAGPVLELGRLCQAKGRMDIAALRLAWAALWAWVEAHRVSHIVGCSSFPQGQLAQHRAALAYLRAHHLGPVALRPGRIVPGAVDLPVDCSSKAQIPALLRSYLNLGGWVGDHAVCDPDLYRVHVFTGLALDDVPKARVARLQGLARLAQQVPPFAAPLDVASATP